MIEYMR